MGSRLLAKEWGLSLLQHGDTSFYYNPLQEMYQMKCYYATNVPFVDQYYDFCDFLSAFHGVKISKINP